MKHCILFGICFLFLSIPHVFSQQRPFSGKITLFNEIPVQMVEVTVVKTNNWVYSDSIGQFTVECDAKDKLSLTASGFKTQILKLKSIRDSIFVDFELENGVKSLDIAISKGHIKARDIEKTRELLNSIKEFSYGFNNMTDLIRVKFPQITISGSELILRGYNSISQRNGALIILNGATYDWSGIKDLNVREIKNIKILSANQAVRYGSGSGNGVLIIELL